MRAAAGARAAGDVGGGRRAGVGGHALRGVRRPELRRRPAAEQLAARRLRRVAVGVRRPQPLPHEGVRRRRTWQVKLSNVKKKKQTSFIFFILFLFIFFVLF